MGPAVERIAQQCVDSWGARGQSEPRAVGCGLTYLLDRDGVITAVPGVSDWGARDRWERQHLGLASGGERDPEGQCELQVGLVLSVQRMDRMRAPGWEV